MDRSQLGSPLLDQGLVGAGEVVPRGILPLDPREFTALDELIAYSGEDVRVYALIRRPSIGDFILQGSHIRDGISAQDAQQAAARKLLTVFGGTRPVRQNRRPWWFIYI